MVRKIAGSILIFLGFRLSPLSPWNDLFTNIPLSYLLASPFSFFSETIFIIAFAVAYWLTNIIGFLLMHYGYVHAKEGNYDFKKCWKKYFVITCLYTVIIILLVYFGILPTLEEITKVF